MKVEDLELLVEGREPIAVDLFVFFETGIQYSL